MNNKGFTLIEVMIALGLLAISLVALNTYQSYAIQSAAEADRLTIATMLARKKMVETELEVRNQPFEELKTEDAGNFEQYPDYSWERRIEEFVFTVPVPKNEDGQEDMTTVTLLNKLSELISEHVMKITLIIRYRVMGSPREKEVITHIVDFTKDISVQL